MGAVETIADIITDNRTYYNCPSCGRRVWAYGSFVGNICWNCPGTLAHAAVKSTDLVTYGMTSTILDAMIDNRTEYECPRCGCKKWAYGVGIGRTCLDCLNKEISEGEKHWFNMTDASEMEVSLNDFLEYKYNGSGRVVTIGGRTFYNVVPRSNLEKAKSYTKINLGYTCGLNAINICSKIWNYDKQLTKEEYEYNTFLTDDQKYGKHGSDFYYSNISPYFSNSNYFTDSSSGHKDINYGFIDGNDYTNNSLIIMGGQDISGHYTIIIGVDTEKRHYLIIDQSLYVWLVDIPLLEKITVYKLTKSINLYSEHSIYRIGNNDEL